jgi:hypothetical protein
MGRIYRALIAAFAVLFGLGLALTSVSAASAGEDAKREDDVREVATVEYDDDDDDSNTGNTSVGSRTGSNTVNSNDRTGDSNDGTNSRKTGVSRDKDRSRGDLTKDWTRDGAGDRTRDWSQNRTNDKSRNDTR